MFLGTYEPKMDDKGRVIMPAKFREQFADGLVVTPGQDRCLYVVSAKEFERMIDDLAKAPSAGRNTRDYIRVLMSGASDELPDKQGRITIPNRLRSYAGLSRDLVVVGVGTRAEIWDADNWARYLSAQEEAFSQSSEEVIPGMF
ncbi:division/cell wall cluster transcriptional repressor MraZ [Actinomyces minihominis]|uniref:division/cell wall cluster transcriptional repressor MraZ n=1 Tax=Actinomyces minihominis TaxID=2002838 RepID=UPI000C06AC12|nr:division/cell wall cluster transcriptional repressor MraZ [Actinomyces minihominis]